MTKIRGRSINIIETANPENQVNLITDVDVNPNNSDDAAVLNKRLDQLKVKTPDLIEIHTDGVYGNRDNDRKYAELNIKAIQTAVRGRQCKVRIDIEQIDNKNYIVRCPHQQQSAMPTRKRYKACFDPDICSTCEYHEECPAKKGKKNPIYYFTDDDYRRLKRINMINEIPPERRKLRSNVEATVREFRCRTEAG